MRNFKEISLEEYDDWSATVDKVAAVNAVTAEVGGPRYSLLPEPDTADYQPPLDVVGGGQPAEHGTPLPPFEPAESRKRLAGWSAQRQRLFVEALAEQGTVHLAASAAGLSARAAYQLRVRSPAFARAWDAAQSLAVGRLSALAFDRAIHGKIEQVWQNGNLVGERRVPSERLLMWLLARLDPTRFAMPWERRGDETGDPQAEAARAFPDLLADLSDTPAYVDYAARQMALIGFDANDDADTAAASPAAVVTPPDPAPPAKAPAMRPRTSAKIGKIGARLPSRIVKLALAGGGDLGDGCETRSGSPKPSFPSSPAGP